MSALICYVFQRLFFQTVEICLIKSWVQHSFFQKGKGGRWQVMSRNPRSSAAGLGQFLSGTWIGEAQRKGTYLNEVARTRGWI